MNVLSIFGTRPEAIKMAPLLRELEADQTIESTVCVSGQHREILDQVLDLFEIEPEYDLDLMEEDQTPTETMANILESLDPVLREESPEWVLVQGDTSTVAAGSLASFYAEARVAHVEAGLRTTDKWNPFPEEINRRIAGVVADKHFAPTTSAKENLRAENVPEDTIHVTGNTVIDALDWVSGLQPPSQVNDILDDSELTVLITAHRRENHGEPIRRICDALAELAQGPDDVQIIYPVHPNPNVQQPVHDRLADIPGINLLPPVEYPVLVHIMDAADLILTDSGGIQEEAPSLGTPVLVLREKTERPEGLEAGTVKLVGTETQEIVDGARQLLRDTEAHEQMAKTANPYGDGRASERIVRSLRGEDIDEFG